MLPEPMSDAEFREKVIEFLLGKDWFVTESMPQKQVNRVAYEQIKDGMSTAIKILNRY